MMMSEVAQVLNGTLHGRDAIMMGVSKDTRNIKTGDLYIALKGERFDGHQFIADAISAGAVGAVVSESQSLDVSHVQVADTRIALGELAAYWRQRFTGKLIGITGSNGKTSVKEMCSKILYDYSGESAVLSTKGNLNNDIGLPMTLLELNAQHQFAVIEMGANHLGEIEYLTTIAKPDVAVVNNAGQAHLEGFGSVENIARAKAEIYDGLSGDGVAVINADDNFASFWTDYCAGKKIQRFSMQDESADVFAKEIAEHHYQIVIKTATGEVEKAALQLKIPGKHNVMNALAATAVTLSVGVPLQSIVDSLSNFENINGRLTIRKSEAGYRVIDDTYNANPFSMIAAIDVLVAFDGRRVLVIGDMGELGASAEKLHADIGRKAKQSGVDALYATGELSASAINAFGENGFYFQNKNELLKALKKNLDNNDVVLVKGSRSAAMEVVVEEILTHHNNNKRVN
jgi:UDP-N-acetylmuramoyl-tripeptide--D-alanyl-D-alanine ligase